jgi:hypothetical protein
VLLPLLVATNLLKLNQAVLFCCEFFIFGLFVMMVVSGFKVLHGNELSFASSFKYSYYKSKNDLNFSVCSVLLSS